ncbi:MAG: glycoside hydrolase family 3 N-terminal domain-containing protein [Bacteroidota bacterium]
MKKVIFLIAIVAAACSSNKNSAVDAIDKRVDSVLNLMTLEEKVGQLTLYTSDWDVTGPSMRAGYKDDIKAGKVGAIFNAYTAKYTRDLQEVAVKETRLGIPLIFGYDVVHGHKTIFPIPLGEAASWDLEAMEKSARVSGEEASAEGLHWAYAPMVDIARDPRWGRIMEGAGEDTYLGSLIAAARVKGLQGGGVGQLNSVAACVKHFAAYGAAQAGRDYSTVDMSERMLREVYLPPYKAAVDAGVATVMTSFNELDGTPATANKYLMEDLLRKEWGFKGFVVTDYTSIMEMLNHGNVADSADATAATINSGVDMDMQAGFFQIKLPDLVKQGKVSEETLNAAVRNVLRVKFELGLFDDPYRYSNEEREKATIMKPEFREASRDVARKSIVLLKNSGVLPLSKTTKTIAIIGPLGKSKIDMIGAWSAAGKGDSAVSIFEGIKNKVPSARLLYAEGCKVNDDNTSGFSEALSIAKQADVVIMSVGEAAWMTGEASSRGILDLPGSQQKLVEEIHKTGKPIVVVLSNGRPLIIPWIDKNIPAVVETWFLGTQAGNAIADVLFGDYNPSGKLPVTFPYAIGQVPIFYNMKNTGRPRDANNKYTSKYLDIPNDPLYPFGFGLSYATFEYGEISINNNTFSIRITNNGKVAGTETAQLYIRDLVGSVTRPVKELKGFQKLTLEPGQFKDIVFTLSPEDLSFYRKDMTFGPEPGKFKVFIGTNSRDVKEADFELSNDLTFKSMLPGEVH